MTYMQELKIYLKTDVNSEGLRKVGAKLISTRNVEAEEKSISNVELTWKCGNVGLFLE